MSTSNWNESICSFIINGDVLILFIDSNTIRTYSIFENSIVISSRKELRLSYENQIKS